MWEKIAAASMVLARAISALLFVTIVIFAMISVRAEGLPALPTWIGVPSRGADGKLKGLPKPASNTTVPPASSAHDTRAPMLAPVQPVQTHTATVHHPDRKKLTGNAMALTNRSGTVINQYPLQFGRPFLKGEISDFPQIMIDGTPVTTQANVTTRHPDGTVKHAILSIIVPVIPVAGTLTITFRNQPTTDNTHLGITGMLAENFDFDAVIEATSTDFVPGEVRHVSARDMLKATSCTDDVIRNPLSPCTYWTKGPVATTIVLADHSPARTHDFGFITDQRAIRPIFHVTFWPILNRVHVRVIAEIGNTGAMQDEIYSVTMKAGLHHPRTIYTKSGFVHHAGTRWSRTFWIGEQPEQKLDIDHNLSYLSETGAFPRYDIPRSVENDVSSLWTRWQSKPRGIGDAGFWATAMPMVGGRPDIGHMPQWTVLWLYTGDWRAREIAFTQADLAANWQLHIREGDPSKKIDRDQSIPALGRTVTAYGRPTLWLFDERGHPSTADAIPMKNPSDLMMIDQTTDKPIPYFGRGRLPTANNPNAQWLNPRYAQYTTAYFDGWIPDGAHQPDPFFAQYLLSGDYWYLEQLQLWAGAMSLKYCAAEQPAHWCRGPGAGIHDEVRGNAWVLRNRVNAALASPDGSPEKKVFTTMVEDALAVWEGERDLRDTPLQNTPSWRFGHKYRAKIPVSPLHFWENNPGLKQQLATTTTADTIAVGGGTSPWMQNFLILELGRALYLGFPSAPLFAWLGENLIRQLTDPGFNPYLAASYRLPVSKADGTFFSSWAELLKGFPADNPSEPGKQSSTKFASDLTYAWIARTAASQLISLPGGVQAWTTINTMLASRSEKIDVNWAIVPRLH